MIQASGFLWTCCLLAAKLVSTKLCKCQATRLTQTPAPRIGINAVLSWAHIRLHFCCRQSLRLGICAACIHVFLDKGVLFWAFLLSSAQQEATLGPFVSHRRTKHWFLLVPLFSQCPLHHHSSRVSCLKAPAHSNVVENACNWEVLFCA